MLVTLLLTEGSMFDAAIFLVAAPLYLALVWAVLFARPVFRRVGFTVAVWVAMWGLKRHQTYALDEFYHINFYYLPLVLSLCAVLRQTAKAPPQRFGPVSTHQLALLTAVGFALIGLYLWRENEFPASDRYLLFFLVPLLFSWFYFLYRALSGSKGAE
jgi:hypothetical protein